MKIKLEGLELVDLQSVRRNPGQKIRVAQDLLTFGLIEVYGLGYRLTQAGKEVLKLASPALQMGQNMKEPLGMRNLSKRK